MTSWIRSREDKVIFRRLQNLENYEIHSIGISNTVWNGDDVIELNIYRKE